MTRARLQKGAKEEKEKEEKDEAKGTAAVEQSMWWVWVSIQLRCMMPLTILSSSRCTQFSAILDSTVSTRSCASFGGFWKKFTHSQRVALVPTRFSVRQSFSSRSGCCLSSSRNWILLEMTQRVCSRVLRYARLDDGCMRLA